MLYRTATVAIVAFWLIMMGLLVRLETHPEATDILDVPVSYVMRLIFRHGQTSFLTVQDQSKEVGTVFLRPSITGTNGRTLNFSGAFTAQAPGAQPTTNSVHVTGAIDMDAALRVRDFHADLSLSQPACHLLLKGDMVLNTLAYQVKAGNQVVAAQTVPITAAGFDSLMAQNLGRVPIHIDPSAISTPAIAAREAEIQLHGEQLEVYQVTVSEGASPIMDIYVTQLGQIVSARTSFGYTLEAED
jgi:hypothetical protein